MPEGCSPPTLRIPSAQTQIVVLPHNEFPKAQTLCNLQDSLGRYTVYMELMDSACKPKLQAQSHDSAPTPMKYSTTGITLIPQPSDDAKDPLVCADLSSSNLILWRLSVSTTH